MSETGSNNDVRIVILQRGWVAVGKYSENGEQCRLDNAAVIRRWGTCRGLGEIATNGPTINTVLDKCPPLRFHTLTVISTMDCEAEKWLNVLS